MPAMTTPVFIIGFWYVGAKHKSLHIAQRHITRCVNPA
jgi:hypothetical protein